MGYLTLNTTGHSTFTMNTATVSVWFRIPTASIDEAIARDASPGPSFYRVMMQAVPIMMWGEQLYDGFGDGPMGPSWIGVSPWISDYNAIAVNIQTSAQASGDNPWTFVPQSFGNFPGLYIGPADSWGAPGPVAADQWHHLFLSWQLATTENADVAGVSGVSTMYCVLDGVERSADSLPALWTGGLIPPSGGANSHCSGGAADSCGSEENTSNLSVSKISTNPFVVPGRLVATEADGNRGNLQIQMAHLQVFGGLMLTSASIGLFKNGNVPAHPDKAQQALGVAPHIKMTKASDFTSGRNRGSLGNFTVIGSITPYGVEPSL